MSLPRYPEYKASRTDWLGEVPDHWVICALAYRYDVALGKMLDEKRVSGEHLAPYLRNVDVQWGRINTEALPQMDFSGADVSRYGLRSGDLLVCEGGEIGRAAIWEGQLAECYYQKALHRLRPHSGEDTPRFFQYVLRSAVAHGAFAGMGGKATIAHLPAESFRRVLFPFPPVQEQLAVASFLDRETARIDALIAEQETLLALLAEKRQATISHAVTRGLDPNVPMKDSGIAWLGEVPAHWAVTTLGKTSSNRCDGPFGSGIKSDHYTEEGALVVRLQNIRAGAFNLGEPVFLELQYFEEGLKGHEVRAGDLLVAGLGDDNNLLGRACVAPQGLGPALVKADCFRFRLYQEVALPAFVSMQLSAGAAFDAGMLATGTTRSRMPLGVMASRKMVLPPIHEQSRIAAFVEDAARSLDILSAQARRGVELLSERRSALISAAVTGQIDVRGAMDPQAS